MNIYKRTIKEPCAALCGVASPGAWDPQRENKTAASIGQQRQKEKAGKDPA